MGCSEGSEVGVRDFVKVSGFEGFRVSGRRIETLEPWNIETLKFFWKSNGNKLTPRV